MKKLTHGQQACVLALLVSSFTAGCSSTSSNTQRGAASGAAIGALAGAVIGNNRGSGNAASGAAIGAAAGAIAGGAIGNRRDRREAEATSVPSSYSTTDSTHSGIYVREVPPVPSAPQSEAVTPQPTSNAVWVPGHWSYESGQNYQWVAGHWEIPPAGYNAYQPPQWRRQGDGYVYVRGHWR